MPSVESISVRNYRCFGDQAQEARLAPLTLLVGENSAGKTSLMALMRALWEVAIADRVPDFKYEPFDLGSFDEIAHHRGARGSRASSFVGGFRIRPRIRRPDDAKLGSLSFTAEFIDRWSAPSPSMRRFEIGAYAVEQRFTSEDAPGYVLETPRGKWKFTTTSRFARTGIGSTVESIRPISNVIFELRNMLTDQHESDSISPIRGSPDMVLEDAEELQRLVSRIWPRHPPRVSQVRDMPFANAPVRSRPQRTYDPRRLAVDPLGEYVPTYLAQLSQRDESSWLRLKDDLESFGRSAGLFDDIRVRRLGKTDVDPFQIQVRKHGERNLGPYRNLMDVGYGVTQVLPVALELLRQGGAQTLLLQQPEVHLHPSAQAALGSLLCDVIAREKRRNPRQIVVETHSDFILDRVRMAVADKRNPLKPDDVAIVYFERDNLDVKLYSIEIGESGRLSSAPLGYRRFFRRELQRAVRP